MTQPTPDRTRPEPSATQNGAPAGSGNGRGDLQLTILTEARRVLLEQGFQGLSTRRIASAVGCTATAIYIYYQNKDALLHALIDEGMQLMHAQLEQSRAAALAGGADSGGQLEAVARAYLAFGFEHPCYYEVMFMLHPKHMERYPAESYRRARRNLETFAEVLAAASGSQPDLVRATTVWTALHGHVALWNAQRTDRSITREALVEGAVNLVRSTLN